MCHNSHTVLRQLKAQVRWMGCSIVLSRVVLCRDDILAATMRAVFVQRFRTDWVYVCRLRRDVANTGCRKGEKEREGRKDIVYYFSCCMEPFMFRYVCVCMQFCVCVCAIVRSCLEKPAKSRQLANARQLASLSWIRFSNELGAKTGCSFHDLLCRT